MEKLLMAAGKLLIYDPSKGYGFITQGNGGNDIFVHAKELIKAGIDLSGCVHLTGMMLEYEIDTWKNSKKQAVNIKLL
jgi:cold shock CspA family protein